MLSVGPGRDSIFQGEHLVLCRCLSALGYFSNITCLQSIPTVFPDLSRLGENKQMGISKDILSKKVQVTRPNLFNIRLLYQIIIKSN